MILKEKSLLVALISSVVVSLVLILTLVGYVIYTELKGEEFKRSYENSLHRINAKIYSKYIGTDMLKAGIEKNGPLNTKPIIEGVITNKGYKNISDILIKVRFLDKDGAGIYEYVFRPQDPALGTYGLPQVSIPGLPVPKKVILHSNESLAFKAVLTDCPHEIYETMRASSAYVENPVKKWSGKLDAEIISVSF